MRSVRTSLRPAVSITHQEAGLSLWGSRFVVDITLVMLGWVDAVTATDDQEESQREPVESPALILTG